jgi:6-phosphogluconolactonase
MRRLTILWLSLLLSTTGFTQKNEYYLLVGTYTSDIHVYKFNVATGVAAFVSKNSENDNPSYLTLTKNGKYVYAVNEKTTTTGEVSAFTFDKTKGQLNLINKTSTGGDGPCYVDVDSTGSWVMVANYNGGNLSALKTNPDGSLQPLAQTIDHQGYSTNFTRQSKPHVHCTVFSPDGKYVFSNDLGTDKIYQYTFNPAEKEPLDADNVVTTDVPDGSGPRHITFHPNRKYAYVINELSGKVIAYQYDGLKLTEIQSIESCTTGDKQEMGSADIHITPNGQYLYTSNRGKANDITIYRVGSTGLLTLLGHQASLGIHPRNFTIDPTGKFLLVANQDSNNIVIFTIIKSTGFLEPTGTPIQVTKPVCLKMVDMK